MRSAGPSPYVAAHCSQARTGRVGPPGSLHLSGAVRLLRAVAGQVEGAVAAVEGAGAGRLRGQGRAQLVEEEGVLEGAVEEAVKGSG